MEREPKDGVGFFVGGCMDGKTAPLFKDERYIRFPVARQPIGRGDLLFLDVQVGFEEYRREVIRTDVAEFAVYVLQGMSVANAMRRLIQHYRPEGK